MLEIKKINNVSICYDDNTNFKRQGIFFHFFIDVDKDYSSYYLDLLCYMLNKESKNYNVASLKLKKFYLNSLICGFDYHLMYNKISFDFELKYVDTPFSTNPNFFKESFDLVDELMFNPKLINNKFDEDLLNEAKKKCIDGYNVSMTKKPNIANHKFTNILDKNSKLYMLRKLDIESLKNVDSEYLYNLYKKILSSKLIVSVIGKCDIDFVYDWISNRLSNNIDLKTKNNDKYPVSDYFEKEIKLDNFKQGVIYKLYRVDSTNKSLAYKLSLTILGTGYSRLFKDVREDKGLCYSINGIYQSNLGVFIVNSTSLKEKIDETNKAIDDSINNAINNGFSQKELDDVKNIVISNINQYESDIDGLNIIATLSAYHNKITSIDKLIEKYKKITLDEVNQALKCLKPAITFKLK